MIAATENALSLSYEQLEINYEYVKNLNIKLREGLKKYQNLLINSTNKSIPFILNISIPKINTEKFRCELEKYDIYVSTKPACCAPNTVSRPVYALTKNRKVALSTLRISLSHLTSSKDIDVFLESFDKCYNELVK